MTEYEIDICKRLKELRLLMNIKQGSFAKAIKTTQGHISDIENMRKPISGRIMEIICLKYNVREDWLRYGVEPIFNPEGDFSIDEFLRQKEATELEIDIKMLYWELNKGVREKIITGLKQAVYKDDSKNGLIKAVKKSDNNETSNAEAQEGAENKKDCINAATRGKGLIKIPHDDEAIQQDIDNSDYPNFL